MDRTIFDDLTDITNIYRDSRGLPALRPPNRTLCGAYLIPDPSGVKMKCHIAECAECQAMLEQERIEWEKEHA